MVLVELMTQRIRTPRDLERRFDIRPVVSIPYIRTRREMMLRKMASRATVFAALVLAPLAIYAVDQFYRPIPLIAQSIGERIGLDLGGRVGG
jgi:hypothetical protein